MQQLFCHFPPVKTSEQKFQFEPCSASEIQEFALLYNVPVDLLELVRFDVFLFHRMSYIELRENRELLVFHWVIKQAEVKTRRELNR